MVHVAGPLPPSSSGQAGGRDDITTSTVSAKPFDPGAVCMCVNGSRA